MLSFEKLSAITSPTAAFYTTFHIIRVGSEEACNVDHAIEQKVKGFHLPKAQLISRRHRPVSAGNPH